MSAYAFIAIMLVCIYLWQIGASMEDGSVVWACSVSMFVILMIRVIILLVKGMVVQR